MSTVIIQPNEFVIRVEETDEEIRYTLVDTKHDADATALRNMIGALMALAKLKKSVKTITNNQFDDDSDSERDA